MRAPRCSRCGRRRSSSTGSAFPAPWARPTTTTSSPIVHHPGGQRALLLREGAAAALLSAQRPQALVAAHGRSAPKKGCRKMRSSIAASTACRRSRGLFQPWMTILGAVPPGVLWLMGGTEDQRAPAAAGRSSRDPPDRIIFAGKKPNPDHLARYPLADLFLDTFPYGAHTTAADATRRRRRALRIQRCAVNSLPSGRNGRRWRVSL